MIIELLTQKGFVQGVDYSYENGVLTALQRVRLVDQEIDHEEIPEVLGAEGDVIEPAVPAWTEVIQVEETYTVQIPSLEELKRELVSQNDPALIISEFLKGKPVTDDDSLNIDLFLKGQGGWRFQNIPAPSIDELFDLIIPVREATEKERVKQERITAGRQDRQKCETALDLIAGFNRERVLTIEQITQLQQTFAQAESLLRANRPDFASQVITAIVPDEVLITSEMKADVLEILNG
jgi:hypothetical protein